MINANNNIAAINVQRAVGRNVMGTSRQLERLLSELRVSRASDDASGLVVSQGLRSETAKLNQNIRNAQQG